MALQATIKLVFLERPEEHIMWSLSFSVMAAALKEDAVR